MIYVWGLIYLENLMLIVSDEKKRKLYNIIKEDSSGNFTYYALVALAAVVATFGLLMNSTAVIIGAMLISPIMNPIIGVSLSITLGDSELFSRSMKALVYGSGMAIIISLLLTLFTPSNNLTTEILSRTKPTIIDLIVALASGAAGAFTMCYKKGGAVLPGVAIATALMPPLCVVGIGFTLHSYPVAFGGFLLFLANLIAIHLASAIIFKVAGFNARDEIDGNIKVRKRLAISITAFIVISIPLSFIMYQTILNEQTDKLIENSLQQNISAYSDADLVNYTYTLKDNQYLINTVVRSVNALSGQEIRQMENALEHILGKPAKLTMKVILTQEVDALTKPKEQNNDTVKDQSSQPKNNNKTAQNNITPDKTIEYAIAEKLKLVNSKLIKFNFSYDTQTASYNIVATVDGLKDQIDPLTDTISSVLEGKLNRKVNITFNCTAQNPDNTVSPASSTVAPSIGDDIYKINPTP